MTHPCYFDPAQVDVSALVDALTAKPDRTPEEECALHTIAELADIIDRFVALTEQRDQIEQRYRQLVADESAQRETEWQTERTEAAAARCALRHRIAYLTQQRDNARQEART